MTITDDRLELKQHLKEQLNFLKKSSYEFDKGDVVEAKRIAVSLRILFHNSKISKSLLGQLHKEFHIYPKIKGKKATNVAGLIFYAGVMVRISSVAKKVEYVPNLDNSFPGLVEQTIDEWWNGLSIIVNGLSFSRKDIILGLANQDGGAHVDLNLKEKYRLLTRAHILYKNQKGEDLENIEFVLMREYAHFVIQAIEKYYNSIL